MSDSQQRLLSTLFSGIPGMMALKNNELRYEVVNVPFCTFIGKAPADIVGKTAGDLYKPDEAAQIEAEDRSVLEKGRPHKSEFALNGVDGRRWFEVTRTPIMEDDGTASGIMMVAVDVTEYKEKISDTPGATQEDDQRLIEAESKLSELLNQLSAAQSKASEAEKNARTLTVKLADMEIKVVEAERKSKQLLELNERVAAAEKEAQESKSKLAAAEGSAGKSSEIQAALNAKTEEAEKLKTDYLAALKQLEELRNWAQQAQYQYAGLQKICKAAEQDRDTFKQELEALKVSAASLESMKTELAQAQATAETLAGQLEEAMQNNTALEEEISKLKQAKKDIAELLKRLNPED